MADTAFVNTAHIHRGDTSIDTSEDIHKHTETDDVRRTFGELGELLLRGIDHPTPPCICSKLADCVVKLVQHGPSQSGCRRREAAGAARS